MTECFFFFFFFLINFFFSKYPAYITHDKNMFLLNDMFDYDGKQSLSDELIIIIIFLLFIVHRNRIVVKVVV